MDFIYKNTSIEDMDGEEWLRIDEFPNYLVSNMGRIKNSIGSIMKQNYSREYLILGLTKVVKNKKKRVTVRAHRIVASMFVENTNKKKNTSVNHINGIKEDNRACNLEWMSLMDNKRDAYRLGHNKYKLTPDDIRKIRSLSRSKMMGKDIALLMGLSVGHVSEILTGKKWSYIT